jgi:predicted nucleic acid-binding protein
MQAIAERWGVLDVQRQAAARPLSVTGGPIAATALEHGLVLVTRNVKDFGYRRKSVAKPAPHKHV